MTVMTPRDRKACELYLKNLQSEFKENQTMLWAARDLDDRDTYLACGDKSDSLFREIQGVGMALERGALPPYSDSEIKRGEALKVWRDAVRRKHQQSARAEIERTMPEVVARIDASLNSGETTIDVEWELICDSQVSAS